MSRHLPPVEKKLRLAGQPEITADWNSSKIINDYGYTRAQLYIEVTAVTDTPSVVFHIQGYDKVANQYQTIASSAAVTGVGRHVLTFGPGQNEVDDIDTGVSSANGFLPRQFRVQADATWGGTDGMTFSALLVMGA